MKLRHLFYLLLICSSCARSKHANRENNFQSEIFIKDSAVYYPIKDNRIKVDLHNTQKASLFDYFTHVELIPLETSDDILIGRLNKVTFHQDRYYVLDRRRIIHVFDGAGKFIYRIDKSGQGPGEYNMAYDFAINPFTGYLDLLDPLGYIFSYDLSGNFVKKSDNLISDSELTAIQNLELLSEKIYAFRVSNPVDELTLAYYDIETKTIQVQEYKNFSRHYPFKLNHYNGRWYISSTFDNVVYALEPDSLIEAFTLDFGKLNYKLAEDVFPRELRASLGLSLAPASVVWAKLLEITEKYPYKIFNLGQNNRYVIVRIDKKTDEFVYLFYDKSTHESKVINRFEESVGFLPVTVTNEYVLSYCNHEDLDKHITAEMLDEANRQKFKDLMNAKEEENPVIIKYYFKK